MAKLGWFGKLWLTRFLRPAGERSIYRLIQQTLPKRILELGLGTLQRTERVLGFASAVSPESSLHYVGFDRFEGRLPTDPPGPSLKQAHQRLHSLARVQLVPGNSDASLSRLCNHLGLFDLILISADNDPRHIERSWFFIQRIVTVRTTVLVETRDAALGTTAWLPVVKARIDELASKTLLKRAG